jgi:DNA invertase Pin-like site-specific DNA recombinase
MQTVLINNERGAGHIKLRGKDEGRYPYNYLEMIENIWQVLELASEGYSQREIANKLQIDLAAVNRDIQFLQQKPRKTCRIIKHINAESCRLQFIFQSVNRN